MQKITKEQAQELGVTQEMLKQLPENILGRLDILKTITEQFAVVNTCRAKMEGKHGEYNTAKKALKDVQETLNEMIDDANSPSLFNQPKDTPQDDFGGAPESPFGKKGKKAKAEKAKKPKRDGLQHPAVSAVTGQKAVI